MSIEEIVQNIVSRSHGITREQIITLIEEKKTASGGYLTNEAAARVVATELGVEIKIRKSLPKIYIQQLVSGLSDVIIFGRVLLVSPPITFSRAGKNGVPGRKNGKVARLAIADKTAAIKVVLWNEKAELSGKIQLGQIAKVSHGYVRLGKDGELELHVGQRGDIQMASSDTDERDFPPLKDSLEKIADITEVRGKVNIEGVVKSIYSASTFQRRDGTQGKVMRVVLEDETGQVPAVFWNNKTEEIAELEEGNIVLLMNAKVKKSRRNTLLELHVEDFTNIEILPNPKSS